MIERLRNSILPKLGQAIVLFALFMFIATVSLSWNLPIEEMVRRQLREVNHGSQTWVTVGEYESQQGGAKLKDVQIGSTGRTEPWLRLDSVLIKHSLFPLFAGKLGASVEMHAGDQDIEGTLLYSVNGFRLRLQTPAFDISRVGLVEQKYGLQVSGTASLDLDARLRLGEAESIEGMIGFDVQQLLVQGPLVSGFGFADGLAIPQIKLDAHAEEGNIKIDTFSIDGDDIWGKISGAVRVAFPAKNTKLELVAQVKFSPEMTRSIGPFLPTMKFQKDEKGYYTRRLSGTIASLR